jgi:signal transduction histidine kinase
MAASVPLAHRLSTKLIVLTILFVLLAEVLIFLPSVANFRIRWLEERLGTTAAVSTVLVQADPAGFSRSAQDDVLSAAGVRAIAVREAGESHLLAVSEMPPRVDEHIDLAGTGPIAAMHDALGTMFFGGDRMLRVFGRVGESDKEFEMILPDAKLRAAMLVYARNIAILSLIISLITATLIFAAIDRLMVRPLRTMVRSMLAFGDAPDDPGRIIRPENRRDEIGLAERKLSDMQRHLQAILAEQKHLAALGLAVSKINHDMRNILASAQLISDRLSMVQDPSVQVFVPKLMRTLDRAVSYTEGVLAYGRTQEAPPSRRRLRLKQLVDDLEGMLGIDTAGVEFINSVDHGFEIDADAEQIFRVLMNLCRNAVQAMANDAENALVRRLTVTAERHGTVSRILVTDTGPGLPQRARENLFAAFRGAAKTGGTGLGLAIAFELVRAHGGTIELLESQGGRTVFAVTIPDQPVVLEEVRQALRSPA